MRELKSHTLSCSGSIATGAAASATLYTFSSSAADCPAMIDMFLFTTPNYANAVNTTVFLVNGKLGTVMWSGAAIARNTAATQALSTYDVWMHDGDYIYATDSGNNGGAQTLTVWVKFRA